MAIATWQYPGTQESLFMGSFRINAKTRLIGWGTAVMSDGLIFTEVDEAKNDVLDFSFVFAQPGGSSYRVIKVPTTQLSLDAMRATAGVNVSPF